MKENIWRRSLTVYGTVMKILLQPMYLLMTVEKVSISAYLLKYLLLYR